MQNLLSKLLTKLSEELEETQSNSPLNIDSIISDIQKKFIRDKNVRELLKKFKNEQLIKHLLSYRNNAAHANIYGELKEITDEEIKDMIKKFKRTMDFLLNFLI